MSSQLTYRERVLAIYECYAPEKIGSVDRSLEKYEGHEDALVDTLVKRYGPEPTPRRGGGGGDLQRMDSAFGAPTQSVVFSDASGGGTDPQYNSAMSQRGAVGGVPQQQQQQAPPQEMDPYESVRAMIRDHGFLCREHEKQWEEAWVGKIPLRTLKKDWEIQNSMLLDGMGTKLSCRARPVKRWQKRYFSLVPPFFYYFEEDKPNAVCKGALYMDRAEVIETEQEGKPEKKILQITSRVSKKPTELDPNGSYSTFQISFDSARLQATWLSALQQVASIPPKQSLQSQPSSRNMMDGMASPQPPQSFYGSPQQQGQQSMISPAAASSPNPHLNPKHTSSANLPQQGSPTGADAAAGGSGVSKPNDDTVMNVPVTTEDIKKRVDRLMAERDPAAMSKMLLTFFGEQVTNANVWWKFMNQVEETPVSHDRYTQRQSQLQQQQQGQDNTAQMVAAVQNSSTQQQVPAPPVNPAAPTNADDVQKKLDLASPGRGDSMSTSGAPDGVSPIVPADGSRSSPQQYQPQQQQSIYHSQSPAAIASPHQQHPQQQLNHSHSAAVGGAAASPTVVDGSWQLRMDRLKARRSAVERILNDIPGSN